MAALCLAARYLLDGKQVWRFPDGTVQYEVTYRRGMKVHKETLRAPDGQMVWQWDRGPDGDGDLVRPAASASAAP